MHMAEHQVASLIRRKGNSNVMDSVLFLQSVAMAIWVLFRFTYGPVALSRLHATALPQGGIAKKVVVADGSAC